MRRWVGRVLELARLELQLPVAQAEGLADVMAAGRCAVARANDGVDARRAAWPEIGRQ